MDQRATDEPSFSSRLVNDSQPKPMGKIQKILVNIDIFSYVPEPHTYPVSTLKSKIASFIFLVIVVGYLTYDFVKFITANSPLINSYEANVPLNKLYPAPQIVFGFKYGSTLNETLNDPTYFTYSFSTINSTASNNSNSVNQQKIPQNLIQNCDPEWLGVYNNVYKNMTCINGTLNLMNIPTQNPNSLSQRLVIEGCSQGGNITCKSATDLYKMTAGGRFILIINLPAGFDYDTGTVDQTDNSVQIYQFFLVPTLYNRISIQYYPFQLTTFPNYFTSWRSQNFFYMQSYEPVVHNSNVSLYNPNIMLSVTFTLFSAVTVVQVEYQTFIARVSEWGALASLIMAIFGLCCLTYNKSHFLKKNPAWKNFDEAMKKKQEKVIEIEMQNTNADRKESLSQQEDNDVGGISAIRKKVENDLTK